MVAERYNIVLIAGTSELADRINAAVRASGVSIKVSRAATPREAKSLVADGACDLIACEAGGSDTDYSKVIALTDDLADKPPVIAVTSRPGNSDPAAALEAGLAGLAYVDLPGHLAQVIRREIGLARALSHSDTVTRAAAAAHDEHTRLFDASGDALAIAETGILVRTNAAWQDLFGAARSGEGASVLELFDTGGSDTLKKALRKQADADIDLVALTESDGAVPVSMELRCIGGGRDDPALELAVRHQGGRRASLAELQLARRLDTDTGLPGRGSVFARLDEQPDASLLLVRIDNFSRIVERVGVTGSDAVLHELAGLLRDMLPEGGFAARFDGTTFGVLVAGDAHSTAESWAKELIQAVGKKVFEYGERSTTVSVSVGIRHDVANREHPLDEAWQAVRAARKGGGGRAEVHVDAEEKSKAELQKLDAEWASRIKSAIKQNRFRLAYQPVAGLDGERSEVFDVLLRLQDESGEDVMPGDFLPSAARTGLTVAIDRWVIAQALQVLRTEGSPGKGGTLFVRLSDESLGDGGLAGWLKKQLDASPIGGGRLAMELSEAQVDSHLQQVIALSATLDALGCGLVLTNFGTGDQSARLLGHLKLDYIKLDAPLIAGLKKDETKRTAVQEIIKEAKSRGVNSIASGIEDANTMALLWQLGIGYIQGHYVQEPEVIVAGG